MKLDLDFYFPENRLELEIKRRAEDFIVNEIREKIIDENYDCRGLEKGKFCWFVLKKKNWATDKAIRAIAKYLGISHKRFNWAGTKDKKAITTQMCSAFNVQKEDLLNVDIKDISVLCAFYNNEKIRLGDLKGNKFGIRMKEEHYDHFYENSKGVFPNYYGMQRFGIRKHSHIIGYFLIKEKYEEAIFRFLTDENYEFNQKAIEARKRLKEEMDFKEAFSYFPKHLYLERMLLNHLKEHPRDYVNAFRKLPRASLLTFVHALQSYIFNREVSIRFKEQGYDISREKNEYFCKRDKEGFPLIEEKNGNILVGNVVGYETETNAYEEEIMDNLGIKKEEFNIKSFPEISAKGAKRAILSPIIKPSYEGGFLLFSLMAGSYATSLLSTFFILKQEY